MGNSNSTTIRERYEAHQYRTIIQHTDPYIGSYQLIKFSNSKDLLYLRTTLEPTKYDEYNCDYDVFSSKMQNNCRNICDFVFLCESMAQEQAYDLVFEFGNYINSRFQREEIIWEFINGIMEGLAFLQAEGLHYPILRKKYTTYVSETNTFKLLNPFCFKEFIDKAIGVYFNCDVDLIEKADFSRQSINRNVKEFAIMVLALIKNVDESYYIRNPAMIKPAIKSLRGAYSDELVDMLAFIIRSRDVLNFIDLRNFIDLGGDRIFHSLSSRDSFSSMVKKLQYNDTQSSLNTQNTYSEAPHYRNGNATDKKRPKHDYSKKNDEIYDLGTNYSKQLNNDSQQSVNRYINNYADGITLQKTENQSNVRDSNKKQLNNPEFLPDTKDSKLKDHSSMFSKIHVLQPANPSPKVMCIEPKDEHSQKGLKSDIQDLRGLHKTIQDITSVNKNAKSSHHQALEKQTSEFNKDSIQENDSGIIETNKDTDRKMSITGHNHVTPRKDSKEKHNDSQMSNKSPAKKKMKRIIMKWITEENKHKEYIEYEDGTMEEKGVSGDKGIQNVLGEYYKRNEISKPDFIGNEEPESDSKPKKSAMHFDVSTIQVGDELPQIVNKSNYNIVLFSTEPEEPPKIIFTSYINKLFTAYDSMKGIVDHKSDLRISKYHADVVD